MTFDDSGLTLRTPSAYTNVAWTKFSQASLRQLAKNPKIKPLVAPFIEIPEAQREHKAEVKIQKVTRLELPPNQSVFGAMFSSPIGIIVMLLIYAANLYAAFEIAIIRTWPIGLVMGVSAALPVLGPIIFLSLPEKKQAAPVEETVETEAATFAVPGQQQPAPEEEIKIAAGSWQAPGGQAEGQVFQRGQFTFNRRFFETKFSGFFGTTRRGAEKDLVLLVKSTSGQFAAERISRIAANDVHFETAQGEVMVPFADIQEIQLKPKGA